jgi:hypothetical protein
VRFPTGRRHPGSPVRNEAYTILRRAPGHHRPTYTARELFRKNQIEKRKRGNRINGRLLRSMRKKYYETGSRVLLAGILGETLPNPDTSLGEVDPYGGLHNWPRAEEIMGPVPDDLEYGFDEAFVRKRWTEPCDGIVGYGPRKTT